MATVRMFSAGRLRVSIPEEDLAPPAEFREALRSAGLRELSPRFRKQAP